MESQKEGGLTIKRQVKVDRFKGFYVFFHKEHLHVRVELLSGFQGVEDTSLRIPIERAMHEECGCSEKMDASCWKSCATATSLSSHFEKRAFQSQPSLGPGHSLRMQAEKLGVGIVHERCQAPE